MAEDICWLSAVELLARFRARTLSPVEVTETTLGRIERLQPLLNAFQLVDADGARRAARASEARWHAGTPMGALDGVPVTIKDNALMKGFPTLHGSRTIDPNQAWNEDAPCVARMREAGAVILGKTTLPEFGWKALTDGPLFGVTRSPWNTRMTPGGSSGGASACLAAGIGPIAFGNDGGGSIRIPASYCGLFGIKPTFGRVPHHPQESPFATVVSGGPLARTVADAALMLNELVKPDARDPYALPPDGRDYRIGLDDGVRGLRVAWSPGLGGAEPDAEVLALTTRAAERLAALGAVVEEVGPVFEPLAPLFTDYWFAGFAYRYRTIPETNRDLMDPRLRAFATQGLEVGLERYQECETGRARLITRVNALLTRFDLLLTPTTPVTAPPVETAYHSPEFDRWRHGATYTVPFNLTGHPAGSAPAGVTRAGLPVGLQIVGARFDEPRVLRAMRAVESSDPTTWPHPRIQETLATA
jgi:aspartyl-tRNA(Asn)/glutamyl-tRNA(Gln) amidotransferase subunit A